MMGMRVQAEWGGQEHTRSVGGFLPSRAISSSVIARSIVSLLHVCVYVHFQGTVKREKRGVPGYLGKKPILAVCPTTLPIHQFSLYCCRGQCTVHMIYM